MDILSEAQPPITQKASGAGKLLKFIFVPDFKKRFSRISARLGVLAHLLAQIFASTRLIPADHPVLQPKNINKYGIRYVIALAANNLTFDKQHTDQILIFFGICATLLMAVLQIFLILIYSVLPTAHAAQTGGIFTKWDLENDVVLKLLQHTFGIASSAGYSYGTTGFFTPYAQIGGAGTTAVYNGPTSGVHQALHSLFGVYSTAMMIIAVLLIVYYVFVVVGEAAYTGKPFGNRLNPLYAPLRIVFALGLLVPLGSGINIAQYIVLYSAKFGTGLANSAWSQFIDKVVSSNFKYTFTSSIAPEVPSLLVRNLFVSEVCKEMYNGFYQNGSPDIGRGQIKFYQIKGSAGSSYKSEKALFDASSIFAPIANGDTNLQFIYTNSGTDALNTGVNVCGRYAFNVKLWASQLKSGAAMSDIMSKILAVQSSMIGLFADAQSQIETSGIAKRYAQNFLPNAANGSTPATDIEVSTKLNAIRDSLATQMQTASTEVNNLFTSASDETSQDQILQEIKNQGWGGAGQWYMTLGKHIRMANGAVRQAFSVDSMSFNQKLLTPVSDPTKECANNQNSEVCMITRASTRANGASYGLLEQRNTVDQGHCSNLTSIATIQSLINDFDWEKGLEWVFGTCLLTEMRESKTLDPMFYLIAFGIEKVERAKSFIGYGLLGQTVGGLIPLAGGAISALSGIIVFFGMIGLGVGFILAYVLPLLPFIYFSISVISWLMAIFQAFIGAPLWALAHVRIDGNSFQGDAATAGYGAIFEILIRPVAIVITLIGVYIMMGASNYFLASMFFKTADNSRAIMFNSTLNGMDSFMLTLLYAITIFGVISPLLKAIDSLPESVAKWGGFGKIYDDPLHGSEITERNQQMALWAYGAVDTMNKSAVGLRQSLGR